MEFQEMQTPSIVISNLTTTSDTQEHSTYKFLNVFVSDLADYPATSRCEGSVSRIRRFVSPARLSSCSWCSHCSLCVPIRDIFLTPLMLPVNRQCCVFTSLPLFACESDFSPSVLLAQFAPRLGVTPQYPSAEHEYDSYTWNADTECDLGAGREALLKMVSAGIRMRVCWYGGCELKECEEEWYRRGRHDGLDVRDSGMWKNAGR